MRIVFVEVDNFRGIKKLDWAPARAINCLIGAGDTRKTTILDAIELALNPRLYPFADDSDFFDADYRKIANITVTLAELPPEIKADDKYGLHLRGWNAATSKIEDEPREGLEEALSLRVVIDGSLEARWSIFNERIPQNETDPPVLRYKHARQLTTTRLGPYAERHLGWSRQSVLTRLGETPEGLSLQLAEANRAARDAFRKNSQDTFKATARRAETLGKLFSVPVREKYAAELDVQGVNITTGGISLHDGKLPLRRLGTGSSRLIVSALQHDAGSSNIALIDEVEHGLEPHRIARLLKYLSASSIASDKTAPSQIFMTTHSPVVIRELALTDIFTVRCNGGLTDVKSAAANAKDLNSAQGHLRRTPEAFLARKIIVGEGRTEQGFLRGLDAFWSVRGNSNSFALCGVVAIDGGGTSAPMIAEYLLDLGYDVFLLLDSDRKVDAAQLEIIKKKGGAVHEWADGCSTEERIFLDVPWSTIVALVKFASECVTADSVKYNLNKNRKAMALPEISDLALPPKLDIPLFRKLIGTAAKNENNPWFKDITRGERVGDIVGECLANISTTPLAQGLTRLRQWVDG